MSNPKSNQGAGSGCLAVLVIVAIVWGAVALTSGGHKSVSEAEPSAPASSPMTSCADFLGAEDYRQHDYIKAWYVENLGDDQGFARRADSYLSLKSICKEDGSKAVDIAMTAVAAALR